MKKLSRIIWLFED